MVVLPRQQIAGLFLALSTLLFVSKEIAIAGRVALPIIFGFSMVVSHYGLSYIYSVYLLMALPLLLLWRSSKVRDLWQSTAARFSKSKPGHPEQSEESRPFAIAQGDKINNPPRITLTATYVMLFIVFCLVWYMYISAGANFSNIVRIGGHIYSRLITDFFRLETRDQHVVQALGLMPVRGAEVEWEIARIFQYITQLFIVVGILGLIASWRKTRFHPEFAVLSLVSMIIIAMCIILPHFAAKINMSRIYHITLFFLAPLCILGGIATFRWLFGILRLHRFQGNHTFLKLVVILVLVPYFLFTTGLIFELTGATPTSQALSLHRADFPVLSSAEIRASEWLANMAGDHFVAYADPYGVGVVYQWLGHRAHWLPSAAGHIHHPSYIFLRHWNIAHNEVKAFRMVGVQEVLEYIDIKAGTGLGNAFRDRSRIYDNGWAQVLGPR
jgi:uncharacterized membrane protein